MKINRLGTLVELDPNKEYIMLFDTDIIPIEQVYKIKIENGLKICAHNIMEGVTFIENSDKIVDIKIRKK